MSLTADDITAVLGEFAGRFETEPTVEQVAPLIAGLTRRERAVLALFFERLREQADSAS
ncbi:hypothetical protein AB4Z18_09170 [Leifsonia sp. 2TAF2]|uniref:hypothetical protein n=1 Tax=Leifsonia sp. 2TAF2 TaxID=3233009 RepID=UPI003F9629D1